MTPRAATGEFARAAALDRMAAEPFDVLVIGGGITGAGVALDAASRGLRTALVERDDFASGTSSQSSKLVHGGLRYLNQREFGLVTQSLAERQRLLGNAPHLVRRMPFVFPVYGGGAAARGVGAALWAYDLAGGFRIGHVHKKITAEDALSRVPALRPGGFSRAYLYYDAHVDDARLTLAVARTAALLHGAAVANHTAFTGLLRGTTGRVAGATVRADGRDIEVKAAVVVNAAGVWVDEVAGLGPPSPSASASASADGDRPPAIRPAKGVHIALMRSKLPAGVAAVLPAPEEGRSIFVIPWPGSDRVYVGTTDTDYKGPSTRRGAPGPTSTTCWRRWRRWPPSGSTRPTSSGSGPAFVRSWPTPAQAHVIGAAPTCPAATSCPRRATGSSPSPAAS